MNNNPLYLEVYQSLKSILLKRGYIVADFKPVLNGCEFHVYVLGNPYSIKMRYLEEKIEFDFSQLKDKQLIVFMEETVKEILETEELPEQVLVNQQKVDNDIKDHILTCVVGDKCRFGPIIFSGIIINDELINFLHSQGVRKSSDIKNIDDLINQLTLNNYFTHIEMTAFSFNEIMTQIKQPEHILAWGQRKLLEVIFKIKFSHMIYSYNFGNNYLLYTHFANLNYILEFNSPDTLPQKFEPINQILNVLNQHIYIKNITHINQSLNLELPYFDQVEEDKVFKKLSKDMLEDEYLMFSKIRHL